MVKCPNCQTTEDVTKLHQPFHFGLGVLVLGLLGGAIGGVFWALGQENKYRCGQCERIFFAHTRVSRVFWALALLTYLAIATLVICLVFLFSKH